ncbi:MAG: hypothetical protein AAB557_05680 [Patescibacteria group bacterium]
MKRILSLMVIMGFFFLIPYHAVHAEVTGPPDITTRVALPNSIDFAEIGEKNGASFLSNIKAFINPTIIGSVGFEGSSVNKPQIDIPGVFSKLGPLLKNALPYLTPNTIIDLVQPITNKYTLTGTSTLCFASDNNNIQAFPLKERIFMDAEGLPQTVEGSVMLSGLWAPQVTVVKEIYEHLNELFPNVLGSILLNQACDLPPPTREVRKERIAATTPEEYQVPPEKLPLYLVDKWIHSLPTIGALCSDTNCNLKASPMFDLLIKTKIPYVGEISKNLTNDPTDPNSKPIGALATLVPEAFEIANRHGQVSNQIIEQTVMSSHESVKTPVNWALTKSTQDYYEFTNCSVHPDSLQSTNLNYSCNFSENDAGLNRELTGGTLSNFDPTILGSAKETISNASSGKIPACVLEGIKYIETGTQTDFTGACQINVCSAAGPYQITVGSVKDETGQWTNRCKACGDIQCPDWWPGDWPRTDNAPNPCDMQASAVRAVEMLQEKAEYWTNRLLGSVQRMYPGSSPEELKAQQNAIIIGANSYYGSGEPIDRLGKCSYGEFVYKHCDPSYTCTGVGKFPFK